MASTLSTSKWIALSDTPTKIENKLQYCVLEIKFPPENVIDAGKILKEISLTRTRSSKYVTGMNTLFIR